MAEQIVQVNPDGTGKNIRTEEVTAGGKTVQQQVITVAKSDGTLLDAQFSNLDLALTALRDAITGVGGAAKTLADVVTAIQATQNVNVTNLPATQAAPNATVPALVQAVAGSDGVILRPFPVTATGLRFESDGPIHLELQKISAGIQLLVGALVGNIALEDVV